MKDKNQSLLEATQKPLTKEVARLIEEIQARFIKYKSFKEGEIARLNYENTQIRSDFKAIKESQAKKHKEEL